MSPILGAPSLAREPVGSTLVPGAAALPGTQPSVSCHRGVSLLAALGLAVAFGEEPDVLMAQALSTAHCEAWTQVPQDVAGRSERSALQGGLGLPSGLALCHTFWKRKWARERFLKGGDMSSK